MLVPPLLRDKLQSYLNERITLREFETWFTQEFWADRYVYNTKILEMVYEIELQVADYRAGHKTLEQLCSFFEESLTTV